MNIFSNGQQYNDWASLPPEVKQKLAASLPDLNHNGVPDLLEAAGATGTNPLSSVMVNVNGQTYTSADQMPPEMQEMLRQALGGLTGLIGAGTPPQPGPGNAVPASAAPTTDVASDQVLLNGVPTHVEEKPEKKHWWQRG
jgi:hypothetical protein